MNREDYKLVKALKHNLNPRETRKKIDKANVDSFDIYKYINNVL